MAISFLFVYEEEEQMGKCCWVGTGEFGGWGAHSNRERKGKGKR